jgi:hypothetical protein
VILTMKDRVALAKLTGNEKERDSAEAAIHLVCRFHEPAVTREEVLDWSLEQTLEAMKGIFPRIIEAAQNGAARELGEKLSKLH